MKTIKPAAKPPVILYVFIFLLAVAASWYVFDVNAVIKHLSMQKLIIKSAEGTETAVRFTTASTEGERSKGLMFVKQLPEDHGMLFVFPEEEPRSFWMKNTYISLDMVFIDSGFKVVDIIRSARPLSTTPQPFSAPSMYVLEVNGGFCDRNKVKVGDVVSVSGTLPQAE